MSILKRELIDESMLGWEACNAPGPDELGVKLWIDIELGEMLARAIAIYVRPVSGALPGNERSSSSKG
jgi:hypothetical protein